MPSQEQKSSAFASQYDDALVSIITPAYKAAAVIEDTIRSVVAQTYTRWELLVAEDCGPDSTRDIVRRWAAQDPRIVLIEAAQNGGPAAARNLAMDKARGRWLAFLDSDDMWVPEKLAEQLAFHRALDGAKISFTGFRRISSDGTRTGRYIGVPKALDYRQLLGNTAIATSTVVVDRKAAGAFRMRKTYYDDFACWLALLKPGGKAAGLDRDLMRYRILDASVSRDKGNSARQVWLAYRTVEQLGRVSAAWHFARYAMRALFKYRRF